MKNLQTRPLFKPKFPVRQTYNLHANRVHARGINIEIPEVDEFNDLFEDDDDGKRK